MKEHTWCTESKFTEVRKMCFLCFVTQYKFTEQGVLLYIALQYHWVYTDCCQWTITWRWTAHRTLIMDYACHYSKAHSHCYIAKKKKSYLVIMTFFINKTLGCCAFLTCLLFKRIRREGARKQNKTMDFRFFNKEPPKLQCGYFFTSMLLTDAQD